MHDAQLVEIKLLQREVASRDFERLRGRGEVRLANRARTVPASELAIRFRLGQQVINEVLGQDLQRIPRGHAQRFLREPTAQSIDRCDASSVNGDGFIVIAAANDFILRMIHREPTFPVLDLAVNDQLLALGDHARHEAHAPPA